MNCTAQSIVIKPDNNVEFRPESESTMMVSASVCNGQKAFYEVTLSGNTNCRIGWVTADFVIAANNSKFSKLAGNCRHSYVFNGYPPGRIYITTR